MIITSLISLFSFFYSYTGTDIKNKKAIVLKSRADESFKLWIDEFKDNRDHLVKHIKYVLIFLCSVAFLTFIALSKITDPNSTWILSIRNEFFWLLTSILFIVKTKNQFITETGLFFQRISKNMTVIVIIIMIYVLGRIMSNHVGLDINSIQAKDLVYNYIHQILRILIGCAFVFFLLTLLAPYLITIFFETLFRKIIIRSNSFADGTPIKHFLKYTSLVFGVISGANYVVTYLYNNGTLKSTWTSVYPLVVSSMNF